MKIRIFLYVLFVSCTTFVQAQIQMNPKAMICMENGLSADDANELVPGESFTGSAPIVCKFEANVDDDLPSYRYEWNFSEDPSFQRLFLTRFEKNTEYRFENSGKFYVRLQITDIQQEITEVSEPFLIQVGESELVIPNAFSPNGDGINDTFLVRYKSLVSFHAIVYNRWGQKLYEWTLPEIDKGWDGTAHGKQVSEGVYYLLVKAKGADGIVYNHRGDINILR